MQFEYYVLNHNFNKDKIELFNIFDNYYKVITKGLTQKEIDMLFYENLLLLS